MRANRDVHYLWGGAIPKEQAQYLPYMVRFMDLDDPSSAERVIPQNLPASFGQGYSLKSLSVRITKEPITRGIERRLMWLGRFPEPRLEKIPTGGVAVPTFAQSLSHGDFLRN
jgi:hypothetical protein